MHRHRAVKGTLNLADASWSFSSVKELCLRNVSRMIHRFVDSRVLYFHRPMTAASALCKLAEIINNTLRQLDTQLPVLEMRRIPGWKSTAVS